MELELLNSWKLDWLVEPIKTALISILENSVVYSINSSKENYLLTYELKINFILNSLLSCFVDSLSSISWKNPISFNIPSDMNSPIFQKIYQLFIKWREYLINLLYEKQLLLNFFDDKQLIFLAHILSNVCVISLDDLKMPTYKDNLISYIEKDLWFVSLFDDSFLAQYNQLFNSQFHKYILNRILYLNLYCSIKSKWIAENQWESFLVNVLQILNMISNCENKSLDSKSFINPTVELPTKLLQ